MDLLHRLLAIAFQAIFLPLMVFGSLVATPDVLESDDQFNQGEAFSKLYLNLTDGEGLSYHEGYATLGALLTPSFSLNSSRILFDLQVMLFKKGKSAGSFGVAHRYLSSNNIVFGWNAYYDVRQFKRWNLNQLGVGCEIFTPFWEFRLNGYLPIGNSCRRDYHLYEYSGDYFLLRERKVSAWAGADAEAGAWIIKGSRFLGVSSFYFAAGPYYYKRVHKEFFCSEKNSEAYGGRIRFLARICDLLEISAVATYDNVWHTRIQGSICLKISFEELGSIIKKFTQRSDRKQKTCKTSLCLTPVNRNRIIVADEDNCWTWNWSNNGNGSDSSSTSTGKAPESFSVSLSTAEARWGSSLNCK